MSDPRLAKVDFRVLRGTSEVGPDLEWADVAFGACGSTAWELCAFGVSGVYLALAENQVLVGKAIDSLGAGIYAGELADAVPGEVAGVIAELLADTDRLQRISTSARSLVDGDGVARVVARMRSHLLNVRRARLDDAELLLRWRMDADVRANSFSSDPISSASHEAWLVSVLDDQDRALYIVEVGGDRAGGQVGQIRFDREPGALSATVSVSVAPEWRGTGWGAALICAGMRSFLREFDVDYVDALIKPGNAASARAFIEADFDLIDGEDPSFRRYRQGRDVEVRSSWPSTSLN